MLTPSIAQIALRFGANDLDGTVVEEKIYHDAGAKTSEFTPRAELERLIRAAGRVPVERDTLYRPVDRSKMPPLPPAHAARSGYPHFKRLNFCQALSESSRLWPCTFASNSSGRGRVALLLGHLLAAGVDPFQVVRDRAATLRVLAQPPAHKTR